MKSKQHATASGATIKRLAASMALIGAGLLSAPAQSAVILLGSDYFQTIQPTFFTPLGSANPLAGLAIGPGSTDTIVQRQDDCALDLFSSGSNCTIDIELVALSLVSTVNPMIQLRETPGSVTGTSRSGGSMMMTSDGSGTGGTFTSFFDVFFDLSFDGGDSGGTWASQGKVTLSSAATPWTTIEPLPPALLVSGLMGDQNANRHTDKNCPTGGSSDTCDFYLVGTVTEQHPGVGLHTAETAVPEPAALSLFGAGLGLLGWKRRRKNGVRS